MPHSRRHFCIMGCKRDNGHVSHVFPRDPKRRAEWFKILGISTKIKNIYLCGAHFPPNSTFGKRISKFALPNPREKDPTNTEQIPQNSCKANLSKTAHLENDYRKAQSSAEETAKPEVLELRDPDSGNHILIGRYYQNNEFLMVTYTQTNKLTHQQQVFLLNHKYEGQLKILERLKRQNYVLTKAVRRHQILFSQLRQIKAKNRTLRKSVKNFQEKSKKLKKRLKKEKLY